MLNRLGKYGVIITLQKLMKMNKYISTEEGTGVSEHRRGGQNNLGSESHYIGR